MTNSQKRAIGYRIRAARKERILEFFWDTLVDSRVWADSLEDRLKFDSYKSPLNYLRFTGRLAEYLSWCKSRNLNSYV